MNWSCNAILEEVRKNEILVNGQRNVTDRGTMGTEANYEEAMNLQKTTTMQETDRKCPQCGGTMDYDPALSRLHCPFCDYTEEIKTDDTKPLKAQELKLEEAEFTENFDWGTEQKTVTCKSCGATTVYDALEVANECPYCGSNQVMEAAGVRTMAPGGVVPFRIDRKTAGERFKSWLGHKLFCPKEAKESAKAESFTGIYLPYWTFDADTHSTYTGEYGYQKKRKNGDKEEVYYEWHRGSGQFSKFIDDELVCACGDNHDKYILSSIEPFKTDENVAYKPEYIAGFAAERYALGVKDAWKKAKEAIKEELKSLAGNKLQSEHSAQSTRNVQVSSTFENITYKYLLLPIWISSFTYKGKVYQFMVNGQSGKVGGKSPISPWRVLVAILIAVLIIVLIAYMSS